MDLRDALERRVGGHDAVPVRLRHLDERSVDAPFLGPQVLDLDVDPGVGLQPLHHLESAAPALALLPVVAVGERLQLVHHEPRDDHRRVDDAGARQLVEAAVDDRGGVEDQRARAAHLPRELDVGDHQPEVVAGGQHHRHGQVHEDDADRDLPEAQVDRGGLLEVPRVGHEVDHAAHGDRAHQSQHRPDEDRDDPREPLVRRERVDRDHQQAERDRRDEQPDDRAEPEVQRAGPVAGDRQDDHRDQDDHEDRPQDRHEDAVRPGLGVHQAAAAAGGRGGRGGSLGGRWLGPGSLLAVHRVRVYRRGFPRRRVR